MTFPFSLTSLLFIIFLYFSSNVLVLAGSANVTVDDNDGPITYAPSNQWSFGPTCGSCDAHIDASQTSKGTWHDTSYIPSANVILTATLQFTGTAVYVYGIRGHGQTFSSTALSFMIDGQTLSSLDLLDSGSGFDYHYLFFQKTGLSNSQHTLTIQNGQNNWPQLSLFLLDEIIYTQETVDTTGGGGGGGSGGGGGGQQTTTQSANTNGQTTNPAGAQTTASNTSGSNSKASGNTSSGGTGTLNTVQGGGSNGNTNPADSSPTNDPSKAGVGANSTNSARHSHTGAIVGGIVGAVVVLALILLVGCLCLRQRRREREGYGEHGPGETDNLAALVSFNSDGGVTSASAGQTYNSLASRSLPNNNNIIIPSTDLRDGRYPPIEPPPRPSNLTTAITTTTPQRNGRHPIIEPFREMSPSDSNPGSKPHRAALASAATATATAAIGNAFINPSRDSHYTATSDASTAQVTNTDSSNWSSPILATRDSISKRRREPSPPGSVAGSEFSRSMRSMRSTTESQMMQLETAVLLAAENQRLREENRRLRVEPQQPQQQQQQTEEEEVPPPPYLQRLSTPAVG